MSKHNNNLSPSSHARCHCGRYATLGELKAGIGVIGIYVCPDCQYHNSPYTKKLSRDEYYASFGIKPTKVN